jgi:hypothetical protein
VLRAPSLIRIQEAWVDGRKLPKETIGEWESGVRGDLHSSRIKSKWL